MAKKPKPAGERRLPARVTRHPRPGGTRVVEPQDKPVTEDKSDDS